MSFQPLFEWMASLAITPALQDLTVAAAFNLVHLLSMVVFAGAVLIVDLRLLGYGLTDQPLAQVARSAQPWLVGALAGLFVTGIPAVMATAMAQYLNPLFWFKMYFLFGGIIFAFTVRRKVTLADEARVGPFWGKVVALTSMAVWAIVGATARMIMLY